MIVCVVKETFLRLLSFLWHQTTRVFPCKTDEKGKSSVSFLKSQIFYSIRAANDIFSDSHVFLRFFGGVLLLLLLVVLPLISSFLFQARIISFFHFERHTKDKQSYVASHYHPHSPKGPPSDLLFLEMITSNAEISRREKKNFKHWYKFLWWFTDRNHVMWVEIKENIDFFFALHRHTALVVVVVDDRRECEVF